jgi:general secretion pathway protein A
MNRPLVLDMVTPERFAAAALILGIENRRVWVASPSGVVEVELAELGPLWTGNYQLLWHPPAGFERPLARGDRSEAVAAVAGLFAQLDGRQQTLTGEEFNAALEQRVRLFQRQHGLKDDGVVGLRTLLVLNEQLGVDLTAAVARQQLAQSARELVKR